MVHALVEECFRCLPFRPTSAHKLDGGYINNVWRVLDQNGNSVILKCYPPFIASDPSQPLSTSRSRYEAHALQWVWTHCRTTYVTVPRVLHFLPTVPVSFTAVVMEDMGNATDSLEHLLTCHRDMSEDAIQAAVHTAMAVGRSLGTWLARLHASSAQAVHSRLLAGELHNVDVQRAREHGQYQAVAAAMLSTARECGVGSEFDATASALHRQWLHLGRAWRGPGVCLIHGDMWPRSILLLGNGEKTTEQVPSAQAATVQPLPSCCVIDWEFSSFGWPSQDVAHLAAHVWMAGHAWAQISRWEPQDVVLPAVHSDELFPLLQRLMWTQWARVGVAFPQQQPCPPLALWIEFMDAYREEGRRYAALDGWIVDGAEQGRYAALHWSAEILARVGTWRDGYIYDGATHHMLLEAVRAASAVKECVDL